MWKTSWYFLRMGSTNRGMLGGVRLFGLVEFVSGLVGLSGLGSKRHSSTKIPSFCLWISLIMDLSEI